MAGIYLLLPQIPMLFMGEEFGAAQPFPFFCDFEGDLADAVRNGRRAEFARFPEFADPQRRELIPDPGAAETFASAKLDWDARDQGEHARWLALYRELLRIRHRDIIPRLAGMAGHAGRFEVIEHSGRARRLGLGGRQPPDAARQSQIRTPAASMHAALRDG